MKIRGWQIDGFGIHRDWCVDDVSPGLTVFHGPNEAGKTTLLAFLRGVLFGYPDGRSNDAKYPPIGGGPHGGRVHLERDADAGSLVVERFAGRGKKLAVTLENGAAGDADDLAERLGHADARLFRNVYAFGLAELQELATLGHAGIQDQLFSAGVTGAGRSARQAGRELEQTYRELFAGVRSRKADRARSLTLSIAECRSELFLRQEAAERYPDLRDAELRLAARLVELKAEAERQQVAERRARKLVELWNEVWCPLAGMREQAAKLGSADQDELPFDARARLEACLARIQADQERLAAIRAEREALGEQLAELRLDEPARAVAARVDALHQQLALHRSRRDRVAELDRQIADCDRRRDALTSHWSDGRGEDWGDGWGERELRAVRATATCRSELREWRRRLDAAREALTEGASARRLAASEAEREGSARRHGLRIGARALVAWALGVAVAAFASGLPEWLGLAAALGALGVFLHRKDRSQVAARAAALDRRLADLEAERCAEEGRLSQLEDGFAEWKRDVGIPASLDADATSELLEDVRRARDLLDERERASADRRRAESEVAAWESGVDDVLADCPLEAGAGAGSGADRCEPLLALRERCERDRTVREHRKPLEKRAALLRERFVACEAALAESRALLGALLEEAGASDADDLQRRLAARDAARELADRIGTGEAELARRIESGGPEEAAVIREELPRGRVSDWEELAEDAGERSARAREERDDVLREHQNAALALERLEQSTEVVDLEAERAALEQELREVLDQWRRLRVARRLIEVALERFEGRHQPGVLREAARLFDRVTGGRYPRIVQSEEDAGFSVVAADGMHRSPGELSRGTAEQLYLCVRLGLVAELSRARVALPVVMDDVLVNFDDERAEAMAGVLAEFARGHQLLFFTCNARTRELLLAAGSDVSERAFPDATGAS